MKSGFVSKVKMAIVPKGAKPRRIVAGPNRGMTMNLDLAHKTQLILGLYEREIYSDLQSILPQVRSAIDIGSAEGFYTLLFLNRPNIEQTISIDPNPDCRLQLLENLRLNFSIRKDSLQHIDILVSDCASPNTVTLDALSAGLPEPILVKIDVDGSEIEVLHGAKALIEFGDVFWLIETHSAKLELDVLRLLSSAGFDSRIIDNARYRRFLPEQRPIDHNRWLVATRPKGENNASVQVDEK